MSIPYLGQTVDILLGQEFLTWLWFVSDTAPGSFTDATGMPFSVSMEQRMVVQGGEGAALETASVSGALSPLREARFGLGAGKKVTKAIVRLEKDGLAWQGCLKAADLSCNGLKMPNVEVNFDEDDPDGLLLERVYLLELFLGLLDALFGRFLALRLSDAWADEVRQMQEWIVAA